MRPIHSILWVSLIALIAGISCGFLSNFIPGTTSVPAANDDGLSLKFNPADLPNAQKDIPYDVEVKVQNVETFVGEFTITEGNLPDGLSLERVPGENATRITGTPKEAGTFKFVMEALCEGTNSPGQTGQKEYTITVEQ
jgi:hypothetical protein